HSF
ncbi:Cytoplasmic protein, partial [Monkeypox virus]